MIPAVRDLFAMRGRRCLVRQETSWRRGDDVVRRWQQISKEQRRAWQVDGWSKGSTKVQMPIWSSKMVDGWSNHRESNHVGVEKWTGRRTE